MMQIRVADVFMEQPCCCSEAQGDENQPIGRGSVLLDRFRPEIQTPPDQVDSDGSEPEPAHCKKSMAKAAPAVAVEQLDPLRNSYEKSDDKQAAG